MSSEGDEVGTAFSALCVDGMSMLLWVIDLDSLSWGDGGAVFVASASWLLL